MLGYEIEFHPVGDGAKAGDAITIRYGQPGQYKVIVIDGGTSDSGTSVVAHIKKFYGADTVVSDVISTHPDSDHSSGLREVLTDLPVERLWLHRIWQHAKAMLPYFANKQWTAEGLADAIRKEYPIVEELIDLATKQKTLIYEPFAGQLIGPLKILSPTEWVYVRLVPQFRKTPDPDIEALKADNMWLGAKDGLLASLLKSLSEKAEKAIEWIPETWNGERLKEGAVTAAENETSTIIGGAIDDSRVVFTADGGVNAINWACNNAPSFGFDITSARFVQVPHHGSRSNVTPSTLNRLIGPILPANSPEIKIAIVSAPKDDANHPRKMVMNAFKRRGAGVRTTQGVRFRYHNDMPPRENEKRAEPLEFFSTVEAYD